MADGHSQDTCEGASAGDCKRKFCKDENNMYASQRNHLHNVGLVSFHSFAWGPLAGPEHGAVVWRWLEL